MLVYPKKIKKYPRIYEVFITSSAPVERLFSFAGLLNTPRKTSISDDHFEELVILKTVFKNNSAIELQNKTLKYSINNLNNV